MCKILLIEDSETDAMFVSRSVAHWPERATQLVHKTDVALAEEQGKRWDVILLDLNLPQTDGLETFQAAWRLFPNSPIIVLTGNDNDDLAMEAIKHGAQDYLVKGNIDTLALKKSIQYALERHKFTTALRESEERYARAVSGANDGIWDWNLETNEIYFSPRWKELLGFSDGELSNDLKSWVGLIHSRDQASLFDDIRAHLKSNEKFFSREYRIHHKNKEIRWVHFRGAAVRNDNGEAVRFTGSQSDVTQRKRLENQLEYDALHDSLTKTPNRAFFYKQLRMACSQKLRDPAFGFAVVLMDINRFKWVNDTLGHEVGDGLLKEFAKRVSSVLRPQDILARLGGDEFALLIHEVWDTRDVLYVAKRVNELLKKPFEIQDHQITCAASMGIRVADYFTGDAPRFAAALVRDADNAMYNAKASVKENIKVFNEEMHRRLTEKVELEYQIRRGLKRNEFKTFFQPMASLETGKIVGLEVLLRWQDGSNVVRAPHEFLPLCKETGLIHALTKHTIHSSGLVYRELDRAGYGDLTLSLNFSLNEMLYAGFVKQLEDFLTEYQVPPGNLMVEIGESDYFHHELQKSQILKKLRKMGVNIAIDNFGTSLSSISKLKMHPADTLKVDRSLIQSMVDEQEEGVKILDAISAISQGLNCQTCALGVEKCYQVSILEELGFDWMQGNVLLQPITPDKTLDFLKQCIKKGSEVFHPGLRAMLKSS